METPPSGGAAPQVIRSEEHGLYTCGDDGAGPSGTALTNHTEVTTPPHTLTLHTHIPRVHSTTRHTAPSRPIYVSPPPPPSWGSFAGTARCDGGAQAVRSQRLERSPFARRAGRRCWGRCAAGRPRCSVCRSSSRPTRACYDRTCPGLRAPRLAICPGRARDRKGVGAARCLRCAPDQQQHQFGAPLASRQPGTDASCFVRLTAKRSARSTNMACTWWWPTCCRLGTSKCCSCPPSFPAAHRPAARCAPVVPFSCGVRGPSTRSRQAPRPRWLSERCLVLAGGHGSARECLHPHSVRTPRAVRAAN